MVLDTHIILQGPPALAENRFFFTFTKLSAATFRERSTELWGKRNLLFRSPQPSTAGLLFGNHGPRVSLYPTETSTHFNNCRKTYDFGLSEFLRETITLLSNLTTIRLLHILTTSQGHSIASQGDESTLTAWSSLPLSNGGTKSLWLHSKQKRDENKKKTWERTQEGQFAGSWTESRV